VQPWDLQSTILDAFGMPTPPELWGRSLLPLARGEGKPHRQAAVLGSHNSAQVMTKQWMYTTYRGQRGPLLYDLQADPTCARDVWRKHPEVVARLRGHLRKHLERQGMGEMLGEYT